MPIPSDAPYPVSPYGDSNADLHGRSSQDGDDILESVAQKFHRIFTRGEHFKVGCALCILLHDNLLTRTQVGSNSAPGFTS